MRLTRKSSIIDIGAGEKIADGFLIDRGFDGYEVTLNFRDVTGDQLVLALERREAYEAALHILEALGVARGRLEEIERIMRKAQRP